MVSRLDAVSIPELKKDSAGRLTGRGNFCRDGILTYHTANGPVREFRSPEANQSLLDQCNLLPVCLEHPDGLLRSNCRGKTIGTTGSDTAYDRPFVSGTVKIFDSAAISEVESLQKIELSLGYECEVDRTPGTYNGQAYDAVQKNLRLDHLAIVSRARGGNELRLRFDSEPEAGIDRELLTFAESSSSCPLPSEKKTPMAELKIDGATYPDIDPTVASVVAAKLQQLEELKTEQRSDSDLLNEALELVESLTQERDSLISERDGLEGRSDGLEEVAFAAEEQLAEMGISRAVSDGEIVYVREDDDEYDDDEYDDDEYDDDEYDDDEEEKRDSASSVGEILAAYRLASRHVPNIEEHLDSEPSCVRDIQLAAIAARTGKNLAERSDEYVDGYYDLLFSDSTPHADSTQELQQVLDSSPKSRTDSSGGLSSREIERTEAWRKPLMTF